MLAGSADGGGGLALAALDIARDAGAMDHPSVVWAQMALSMLNADRLDVGVAEIHLGAVAAGVGRCRRPVYDQFHHILKVRHLATARGAESALAYLRDNPPHGRLRPLIEQALASLHVQLLVRTGAVPEALRLVESRRGPGPAARFDVLLASGDAASAREVLGAWDPPATNLRATVERILRRAAVADKDGHPGVAGTLVADAAERAEVERLLAPFMFAPQALHLLRTAAPARRLRWVRTLLDTPRSPARSTTAGKNWLSN